MKYRFSSLALLAMVAGLLFSCPITAEVVLEDVVEVRSYYAGPNSLFLTWAAVPGAHYYEVIDSSASPLRLVHETTELSYLFTDLPAHQSSLQVLIVPRDAQGRGPRSSREHRLNRILGNPQIQAGSEWRSYWLHQGAELEFRLPATIGKNYEVLWQDVNDKGAGNPFATAPVRVSLETQAGDVLWSNQSSGYTIPAFFRATTTEMTLKVRGKDSQSQGFFQLSWREAADQDWDPSSSSVPTGAYYSGPGQVRLHWQRDAGATGYRIYRGELETGPWTLAAEVTSPGHTLSGLELGEHWFDIRALQSAQESALAPIFFRAVEKPLLTQEYQSFWLDPSVDLIELQAPVVPGVPYVVQWQNSHEAEESNPLATAPTLVSVRQSESSNNYFFQSLGYVTPRAFTPLFDSVARVLVSGNMPSDSGFFQIRYEPQDPVLLSLPQDQPQNLKLYFAGEERAFLTWDAQPGVAGWALYQGDSSSGPWSRQGLISSPGILVEPAESGSAWFQLRPVNAFVVEGPNPASYAMAALPEVPTLDSEYTVVYLPPDGVHWFPFPVNQNMRYRLQWQSRSHHESENHQATIDINASVYRSNKTSLYTTTLSQDGVSNSRTFVGAEDDLAWVRIQRSSTSGNPLEGAILIRALSNTATIGVTLE